MGLSFSKRFIGFGLLLFILVLSPVLRGQNLMPKSEGQVIHHTYYSLAYSEAHEQAYWVYYYLKPDYIHGPAQRSDRFKPDPKVKTGSATLGDYKGSGYDRGHLCPAAAMRIDQTAMDETFYFSNMSPQKHVFNGGKWKELEELVRTWVDKEQELHVVTGPILDSIIDVIGYNKVSVPGSFYKVIYKPGSKAKMIAFILPHTELTDELTHYIVSVDAVEKRTHIDFFPALDDTLENRLEQNSNPGDWGFRVLMGAPDVKSSQPVEKQLKNTDATQCLGIAKSTKKRCRSKTTNENGYCNDHQNQNK